MSFRRWEVHAPSHAQTAEEAMKPTHGASVPTSQELETNSTCKAKDARQHDSGQNNSKFREFPSGNGKNASKFNLV